MKRKGLDTWLDAFRDWAGTTGRAMAGLLVAMAAYKFVATRLRTGRWLPTDAAELNGQRLGLVSLFIFVGWLLFKLRSRQLRLYGGIEIGVAVMAFWDVAGTIFTATTGWLTAAGALYVLVRGLDNWSKGEAALATSTEGDR